MTNTSQLEFKDKEDNKQQASLRQAIGLLNNRIVVLERRNRSLDALVRRLSTEMNQLKVFISTRAPARKGD
jgi:hypothetical protein